MRGIAAVSTCMHKHHLSYFHLILPQEHYDDDDDDHNSGEENSDDDDDHYSDNDDHELIEKNYKIIEGLEKVRKNL